MAHELGHLHHRDLWFWHYVDASAGVGAGFVVGGPAGAIFAAAVSTIAGYIVDKYWDDISNLAQNAVDNGLSVLDAMGDALNNLGDAINDFIESPAGELQDALDYGQGILDDIAAALPEFPNVGLPPWLQDALGSVLGTPGYNVVPGGGGGGLDPLVFDLDNSGTIDLDNNGTINGATELFGSNFPLSYILETGFATFNSEEISK